MEPSEIIFKSLNEGVKLREAVKSLTPQIEESGRLMAEALRKGQKLLFCGNGGSAADAQHIAAELVGKFQMKRGGLPALALTTNTSTLTAVGNDFGYEEVFARQVEAFAQRGDVLVGISTSGKSPNVIAAVRKAKERGVTVLALTGALPNPLAQESSLAVAIPSLDTQRIQELHITVGHIWCELIEFFLYSEHAHTKNNRKTG